MERSDILFVQPPTSRNNNRYSLGILYISAYLRAKGYDNNIFDYPDSLRHADYTEEMAIADCITTVKRLKPRIIFFSAATTEAYSAVQLLRTLRKVARFTAVIGGYHASCRPRDFIENGFDFVLMGEAEMSSCELVRALDARKPVSGIAGLVWKRKGKIVTNKPFKVVKELDALPLPAYDKIAMEKYVRMQDGIIRGIPLRAANVAASRGCPYNCSFCASSLISGRSIRYRSAESIEHEVRFLRDIYGIEAIWFTDDTLTVSKEHVKKVCAVMKREGMFWGCQARIDCIDEELIRLLKESGCLQIDFGIESGSKRILNQVMGKGFRLERAEEVLKLCNSYRIRTLSNFIIGLPTETWEDLEKTIALAKRIKSSFYRLNLAVPLPGTRLYQHVGEEITIEDYAQLNFSGDANSDRFNKSEIPDLKEVYDRLNRWMLMMSLRNSFGDLLVYLKVTASLPRKRQRVMHVARHVGSFLARNLRRRFG